MRDDTYQTLGKSVDSCPERLMSCLIWGGMLDVQKMPRWRGDEVEVGGELYTERVVDDEETSLDSKS